MQACRERAHTVLDAAVVLGVPSPASVGHEDLEHVAPANRAHQPAESVSSDQERKCGEMHRGRSLAFCKQCSPAPPRSRMHCMCRAPAAQGPGHQGSHAWTNVADRAAAARAPPAQRQQHGGTVPAAHKHMSARNNRRTQPIPRPAMVSLCRHVHVCSQDLEGGSPEFFFCGKPGEGEIKCSVHPTPLLRPNAHILRLPFEL